jgi:lipid-A-disaccharide synthase
MSKSVLLVSGGEYGELYSSALAELINESGERLEARCVSRDNADAELDKETLACVVLVDFSRLDKNLIRRVKAKGVPVVWYAGTSDMAKKASSLSGLIDQVLTIYPFETELYKAVGLDVEFTGHPLVDIIPQLRSKEEKTEAKAALGYDRTELPVTLISGGATTEEASRMMDIMFRGAAEGAELSIWKVKIIIPDSEKYDKALLEEFKKISPVRLRLLEGQRHEALLASEAAVVVTGTPGIEAALAGAQMLTIKKTPFFKYILNTLGGWDEFVGLPNRLLGKMVCPELTQGDVTIKQVTNEMTGLMEGSSKEIADRELVKVRELISGDGGERGDGTLKQAVDAIRRVAGG